MLENGDFPSQSNVEYRLLVLRDAIGICIPAPCVTVIGMQPNIIFLNREKFESASQARNVGSGHHQLVTLGVRLVHIIRGMSKNRELVDGPISHLAHDREIVEQETLMR